MDDVQYDTTKDDAMLDALQKRITECAQMASTDDLPGLTESAAALLEARARS